MNVVSVNGKILVASQNGSQVKSKLMLNDMQINVIQINILCLGMAEGRKIDYLYIKTIRLPMRVCTWLVIMGVTNNVK